MTCRTIILAASILSVFLTSCSQNQLALVPKSRIQGLLGWDSFNVPPPSPYLVAQAADKPKDRHSMPVYSFRERTRLVRTTAYTSTERDHLKYGSLSAYGTLLRYSSQVRSAAADWSFYPVGTTFRIKGLPYLYVVDDYGSALTGTGTIDIYNPTKEMMQRWGSRKVEMTVVQWGSFGKSAELLSKRTQYQHCRQMLSNILRLRPELRAVAMR